MKRYQSPSFRFYKAYHSGQVAFRALAILSIALLLPSAAAAQDIFGRISGTVSDPSGAAVPHAKVTIVNQDTKLERTVYTNDQGFYVASQLPAGAYRVVAEEKGFKTTSKAGNDLVAGAHLQR